MKPRTTATNWDALTTSAPLNADAAKVVSQRGTAWAPEVSYPRGFVRADICPPMKAAKDVPATLHGAENLTGLRFGRLRVMGKHLHNGAWVVRCDCGWFECRKSRVLMDGAKSRNWMCSECCYLEDVKSGDKPSPDERKRLRELKAAQGTP